MRLVTFVAVGLGLSLGNASTLRGTVPEQQSVEARKLTDSVWPPPFLEAYNAAFPHKHFMDCEAFLENDPVTGTSCHKRTQTGDYSCFYGEQTCESDTMPSVTVHPRKICDCNVVTGVLTCDLTWTPCKTLLPPPPSLPVDPMPPLQLVDSKPQTMAPLVFGSQDFVMTPQNTVMTPPPFGAGSILGEDARPNFDGTWDGSLDLDAGFGQPRGTAAPDLNIANDERPDLGGGLGLPGDAPVTRTNWPEQEGKKCADAAAAISQETNVYEVECVVLGGLFSFDFNEHRVRIFYKPDTEPDMIVAGIPMLG